MEIYIKESLHLSTLYLTKCYNLCSVFEEKYICKFLTYWCIQTQITYTEHVCDNMNPYKPYLHNFLSSYSTNKGSHWTNITLSCISHLSQYRFIHFINFSSWLAVHFICYFHKFYGISLNKQIICLSCITITLKQDIP